jgi:hypothetical protein
MTSLQSAYKISPDKRATGVSQRGCKGTERDSESGQKLSDGGADVDAPAPGSLDAFAQCSTPNPTSLTSVLATTEAAWAGSCDRNHRK